MSSSENSRPSGGSPPDIAMDDTPTNTIGVAEVSTFYCTCLDCKQYYAKGPCVDPGFVEPRPPRSIRYGYLGMIAARQRAAARREAERQENAKKMKMAETNKLANDSSNTTKSKQSRRKHMEKCDDP